MKKVTFSLNYRKPKADYSDSEELIVCIRYYYKLSSNENAKIKQISTGVRCKISDWDTNWHKKADRDPIKKTDPDYRRKNKVLRNKAKDFLKNKTL